MKRLVLILLALGASGNAIAGWHSAAQDIFGTEVSVQLWHDDNRAGVDAISAVFDEMHRIDALMSTWRDDTEMAAVNAGAATTPVEVSVELFELIRRALELAR